MASSPSRPRDAPAGSPRVVFAPDSFKGSLASDEVARILAEELRAVMPSATCVSVAAADGGEGTCAAVAAARERGVRPGGLACCVRVEFAHLNRYDGSVTNRVVQNAAIALLDAMCASLI